MGVVKPHIGKDGLSCSSCVPENVASEPLLFRLTVIALAPERYPLAYPPGETLPNLIFTEIFHHFLDVYMAFDHFRGGARRDASDLRFFFLTLPVPVTGSHARPCFLLKLYRLQYL